MRYRAASVLAGVLWALAFAGVPARAQEISLRLEDVDSQMLATSPRARIIAQQVAASEAGRDDALRWSFPSLSYDHEDAGDFREWQLTLGKRFEKPLSPSPWSRGWSDRVRAASLRQEQETQELAAELRSGYVRLGLYDRHLRELDGLAALVDRITAVASARHESGELAGTDARLLRLAAYTIAADGRRVGMERRRLEASWRADMGLPATGSLRIASDVDYRPFALPDGEGAGLLEHRPGLLALDAEAAALGRYAAAARPGLLPAVEVYGGIKRYGGGDDGFVAGIAVDLPFGRGKDGLSRVHAAAQVRIEHERRLALARAQQAVVALGELITGVQPSLAGFAAELRDRGALGESLLLSFREGATSLEGLLSAVQVLSAALASHHQELASYYENLFRLEAVTGAAIVRLAPGE